MAAKDASQFAVEIARIVHENKSENVVVLDLRGISPVTDFVVIGSGTSNRQMRAVADEVQAFGKRLGERPFGVAGYENAQWILLDFVDVVVHLFSRNYRSYYDLELLWGNAPKLDWVRSESA